MRKSIKFGGAAAAVVMAAVILTGRPGELNATPGWKWVTVFKDCFPDCTPSPAMDFHCPCVEMPPIVVTG